MKRAEKHLDPCEDETCKFRAVVLRVDTVFVCAFGPRNHLGCYKEGDTEVSSDLTLLLAKAQITLEQAKDVDW